MKNKVQQWPQIIFKFYNLAIIVHWPDKIPMYWTSFKTVKARRTKFVTHVWVTKLIGPVYWLDEFHLEVIKKDRENGKT